MFTYCIKHKKVSRVGSGISSLLNASLIDDKYKLFILHFIVLTIKKYYLCQSFLLGRFIICQIKILY